MKRMKLIVYTRVQNATRQQAFYNLVPDGWEYGWPAYFGGNYQSRRAARRAARVVAKRLGWQIVEDER